MKASGRRLRLRVDAEASAARVESKEEGFESMPGFSAQERRWREEKKRGVERDTRFWDENSE